MKKNLDVSVLRKRADPEENYLLLEVSIAGNTVVLGSIYGPNTNNRQFFTNLERDIESLSADRVILAGDWNCTVSTEPVRTNIDCINMNNVPNRTHSLVIQEMCERLSLVDPYRVLNPEKREYTYVPRAAGAKNRSGIDFFLISTGIVALNMNCTIADHLQNKLFDHRAVFLDFKKNLSLKHNTGRLNNNTLKDDITELIIFSSCAEAYALHASPRLYQYKSSVTRYARWVP
jgi:exonuclease III